MAEDPKNQQIPMGIPVATVVSEKEQQFAEPHKEHQFVEPQKEHQFAQPQYAMPQQHPGMPPQQAMMMPPGQPMMHYVQSMPMQDATSMGMPAQPGVPGGGRFCPHGQHVWGTGKPTMLAWVICITGTLFLFPLCCSLFMCKERQCQVCGLKEEQNC